MLHIETLLAHAGCQPDSATGAVVSPLHLSTTFERSPDGSYPHGFLYSRNDNPTRRQLEQTLASLEGGSACAAFASGMAATMAVLQALRPQDHVIIPDDVYYGVRRLLTDVFAPWGIEFSAVDMSNPAALRQAFRPETRLVWAETPSNPMLKITDLADAADAAHSAGALLIVDSTWPTPVLQRPLDEGADLVMHSITKYLAGHSDVLGGAIVIRGDNPLFDRVRGIQLSGGAVMDPFSAWLTLRGLRTLSARMRVHCENASAVAAFLADHARVRRVYYPGLADHPGYDVAQRQMQAPGGMLSFEVDGSREEAMAVAARVEVFTRATSLGGTESLIEHRASIEKPPTQTPDSLLRVSVGLEHIDDLLTDLSRALQR